MPLTPFKSPSGKSTLYVLHKSSHSNLVLVETKTSLKLGLSYGGKVYPHYTWSFKHKKMVLYTHSQDKVVTHSNRQEMPEKMIRNQIGSKGHLARARVTFLNKMLKKKAKEARILPQRRIALTEPNRVWNIGLKYPALANVPPVLKELSKMSKYKQILEVDSLALRKEFKKPKMLVKNNIKTWSQFLDWNKQKLYGNKYPKITFDDIKEKEYTLSKILGGPLNEPVGSYLNWRAPTGNLKEFHKTCTKIRKARRERQSVEDLLNLRKVKEHEDRHFKNDFHNVINS